MSASFACYNKMDKGSDGRNKDAVMLTHEGRMLEYCDSVYRMEDGRLEKTNHNYPGWYIDL